MRRGEGGGGAGASLGVLVGAVWGLEWEPKKDQAKAAPEQNQRAVRTQVQGSEPVRKQLPQLERARAAVPAKAGFWGSPFRAELTDGAAALTVGAEAAAVAGGAATTRSGFRSLW